MSFHTPDFRQRNLAAAKAKSDQLAKFKLATNLDDPAIAERRAAREAIVKAREARIAEREAARIAREKELMKQAALEAQRAEQQAALEAERIAIAEREAAEAAAKVLRERAEYEALLIAADKSIREAKHAARKGGKKDRREAWMKLTKPEIAPQKRPRRRTGSSRRVTAPPDEGSLHPLDDQAIMTGGCLGGCERGN